MLGFLESPKDMRQTVERVMWEDIRRDCKYPKSDNNKGFIYGLNLLNVEAENEIVEVQWFKKGQEREDFITDNNLRTLN